MATPAHVRRILDEVPSSAIGVVFDPCNLIGTDVQRQNEIVDSAFDLFGDRIILAHLKDIYDEGGQIRHGVPGRGLFHTAEFLDKLQAHKPMLDVSLEEITLPALNETVALLHSLRKG
ncbi:Xylose isomerase-like TIM barrel [compost metagenome]